MTAIKPSNLAAQLSYRGRGNPPNSHPVSAISNCFPGLEFDFRAVWRRMFAGIELSENNNYVVAATDSEHADLVGRRLLVIDEQLFPTSVPTQGVTNPGLGVGPLGTIANPNGVSFMEWSNSLARIFASQGKTVTAWFTSDKSIPEVLPPADPSTLTRRELMVSRIFEISEVDGQKMAVISREMAEPGEFSQGLCSPWQNDYRECACYYWAASRPDYVNVTDGPDGVSRGDNWMAKQDSGKYIPDDRKDERLWSYDDLFIGWQKHLRFIVGGSDEQDQLDRQSESE